MPQIRKCFSSGIPSAKSYPRFIFGVEKLSKSLREAGYMIIKLTAEEMATAAKPLLIVATDEDDLLKRESYHLISMQIKRQVKNAVPFMLQITR